MTRYKVYVYYLKVEEHYGIEAANKNDAVTAVDFREPDCSYTSDRPYDTIVEEDDTQEEVLPFPLLTG